MVVAEYKHCPKCAGALDERVVKAEEPARLVCTACGFVFYLDPKVATGTISVLDGGIVLLRRAIGPGKGKWVFPGGFVDRGEALEAGAVRETLEETGLRVSLLGILNAYSFAPYDVALIVYAADVLGGDLVSGDEALEVRTFPPEQIPWSDLAFASTGVALRDYLRRYFPRVRFPRADQGA